MAETPGIILRKPHLTSHLRRQLGVYPVPLPFWQLGETCVTWTPLPKGKEIEIYSREKISLESSLREITFSNSFSIHGSDLSGLETVVHRQELAKVCGSHQLKALFRKPQPTGWSILLQGHNEYPTLYEGKGKSHIAPRLVTALLTPI